MADPKPTILFVHGAFHTVAAYQTFLDALQARGYDVVAPELPSSKVDETMPADPAGADIAHVAQVAAGLADEGIEMVVVAHSYGGVVVTDALHGLGLEARRACGLRGGVKRLVYVCAFVPGPGMCLDDAAPAGSQGSEWWIYEGDMKVLNPAADIATVFYEDAPAAERQRVMRGLVTHPKACSFHRAAHAAYAEMPTTFVHCARDLAFAPAAQRAIVAALKDAGVPVDEVTLDSGHFPTLSMPDRLADVVVEAAAAVVAAV